MVWNVVQKPEAWRLLGIYINVLYDQRRVITPL
jgi:hypothetical protein